MNPSANRSAGLLVVLLAAASASGCNGGGLGPRDGGVDGQVAQPGPRLPTFEVKAVLKSTGDGFADVLPRENTFTLALDAQARHAIVGNEGTGTVVPVETSDGRTFTITTSFPSALPFEPRCVAATYISYSSLEITVTGTTLTGRATGAAMISCGDCHWPAPFEATLTGTADTKAPFLVRGQTVAYATPFDDIVLLTSKPLPATAKARLVGSAGSTVELEPTLTTEGSPPLIVGFRKPQVVLALGERYTAAVDGLVDFAGRTGASDPTQTPLTFGPFEDAPLIVQDGFESESGTTVGGATIVKSGPLAPITGASSVYVASSDRLLALDDEDRRSLNVRLALPPGSTRLRFSYRVVSPMDGATFEGRLRFGAIGHALVQDAPLTVAAVGPPESWPGGISAFVSPVAMADFQLPGDAQGELLVSISPFEAWCLPPLGVSESIPSLGALLIDDLRVE